MLLDPYRYGGYLTTSVRVNGDRVVPATVSAPSAATKGLLSFWIKPISLATEGYLFHWDTNFIILALETSGAFAVNALSGVSYANGISTTLTQVNVWSHIAMSWDNVGAVAKMTVDGVTQPFSSTGGSSTAFNQASGMFSHQSAAAAVDAEIAEWYFNQSEYLDISVAANLQKLRSAAGKPVNLGADGSVPTGTVPHYYFRGGASSFLTNLGLLGNSTVGLGALADGLSSPSD